jgi:hypothetical protein
MNTVHSYSSLSLFNTCPKQYAEIKVFKRVSAGKYDPNGWGDRVHKAIEAYIIKGTSLPEEMMKYQPEMDMVDALTGQKLAEKRMGISKSGTACEFFDKSVWIRGSADFVHTLADKATVVDWKTGSNKRPDEDQLHLMALMTMLHKPQVNTVSGVLIFLEHQSLHTVSFSRAKLADMWAYWVGRMNEVEQSEKTGTWLEKPSGLCNGWCPVESCQHWNPKK